jgi:tRNA A37 threonylcarbamoyladenosine synthetase subunit TsaC/SUA5/YrdC
MVNRIYLAQTDTTVGFLSKDKEKLNKIKNRPINQPILREVDSLDTLKTFVRVPKKFRKVVRRAKKTTFIYPNQESFRVIKDEMHLEFLQKFKWLYSTSANRHKEKFDIFWARSVADVVVEDKRGLFEGEASKIIKLGKIRCKRLR